MEDKEEEEGVLRYSRAQRERYVATLLKKYQLNSLPRLASNEETVQRVPQKRKPIRKQERVCRPDK